MFATLVLALVGEVFTVRSDGSGDFADLQAALDAAPAGATLLCRGSFEPRHRSFVPSRDVSIVGDASGCAISSGVDWDSYIPALLVDGPCVTLSGVTLRGSEADSDVQGAGGIGLEVVSGTAILDQCVVSGAPDILSPGGHGAIVWGGAVLLATGCEFSGARGSDSESSADQYGAPYGYDGGHGILALDGATVALADCTLVGGDGGDAVWISCDMPPNCSDFYGGNGGSAISGDAWSSGSSAADGVPGTYVYTCTDWGCGSDGSVAPSDPTPLPESLTVSSAPPGGTARAAVSGPPSSVVVLLVALEPAPAIDLGAAGVWFLGATARVAAVAITDGSGLLLLDLRVPDDPCLQGLAAVLQAKVGADPLTEPEATIVQEIDG